VDVVEGEAEVSCHACFGYEGCLGEEVWVWVDIAFSSSSAVCLRMKRADPSSLSQGFRPKLHGSRRLPRIAGLSSSTLTGRLHRDDLRNGKSQKMALGDLQSQVYQLTKSIGPDTVVPQTVRINTRTPLARHSFGQVQARKIVYMMVHTSPGVTVCSDYVGSINSVQR
jgi:hypothetical protein